jgi:hypothetical protein
MIKSDYLKKWEAKNNVEVVNFHWRSSRDTYGFVLLFNKYTDQYDGRFGIAYGIREDLDVVSIAEHGAKLFLEEVKAFFPDVDIEKDNYKHV